MTSPNNDLETNPSKIYAEWIGHRYFLCELLDRLQDDWDYTEYVVPQAKDLLTFLDDILKDYK